MRNGNLWEGAFIVETATPVVHVEMLHKSFPPTYTDFLRMLDEGLIEAVRRPLQTGPANGDTGPRIGGS